MVSLILLRWVTLLAVPRRVRVFPFLEGYIPKSANPLSSKREVKERMTESLRRTKLRINFLSLPKLLFLLRQLRARKPSCRESLTSTPSPMRKSETIKSYSLDGLLPSKPSRMRKWDNRNSACRESLSSTPFLMKKWGSRDRLLFSELSRMSNSETGNPARQRGLISTPCRMRKWEKSNSTCQERLPSLILLERRCWTLLERRCWTLQGRTLLFWKQFQIRWNLKYQAKWPLGRTRTRHPVQLKAIQSY